MHRMQKNESQEVLKIKEKLQEQKKALREEISHAINVICKFGVIEDMDNVCTYDTFKVRVEHQLAKKRKEIIEALYQLPLVIEVNTERGLVGLVHADVPKKMSWTEFKFAIENNDEVVIETALWGRTRLMNEIEDEIPGLGRLYVGHTVQDKVKKLGNVVREVPQV